MVTFKTVRIISKAAITEFSEKYEDAVEPLMHWYRVTKRARWNSLADVRKDFRHADVADVFTIFNIAGTSYRLITVIKYRWQVVYIRHVLTHREYDKEKWRS